MMVWVKEDTEGTCSIATSVVGKKGVGKMLSGCGKGVIVATTCNNNSTSCLGVYLSSFL